MVRHIVAIAVLGFAFLSFSHNAGSRVFLSEGAKLLFKDVKTKLTDAQKDHIFTKLQLKLSKDKKTFMIDEYTVSVSVFPTDMNKDGVEEVFVVLGSGALFGNTGEAGLLFLKDKSGIYQQEPDIGGGRPGLMRTKNLGFNDLYIGGPGFEFPLYRWDGKKYKWFKKISDSDLAKSIDLETFSKEYTNTINR